MPLIKDSAIVDDAWIRLDEDADAPADGDLIVSFARLLAEAPALLQRDGALGVRVAAGDDVEDLAPHVDGLALVALEFPTFVDGRAFSSARLLRERYGFEGELRAVGDVLRDQLFYMVRCGFDAFEIARDDAADVFAEAMGELSVVYQPAGDDRRPAWLRRRETSIVSRAGESPADRAARLNAELRDAPAPDILRAALAREFGGRIAVVSSFGAESAVLVHMVAQIDPATPVLFLETGKHFPETADHRLELTGLLGLTDVRRLRPDAKELLAEDREGELWSLDPDACCALRKKRPLGAALAGFDAWVTGRKRFQTETRLTLPVVEVDEDDRLKFNPLANWGQEDLDSYLDAHDLPRHPLVAEGYLSIGCAPCTSPVAPGEGVRAGRWRGMDKEECGIHFTPDGRIVRTSADASER